MNIIKYNKEKGTTTKSGAAASSTSAGYSEAIASINQSTNQNASDIAEINKILSGLDAKYLKHGGDDDEGAYEFGQVASFDFHSPEYFSTGMGFHAVFDAGGYEINVRDLGATTLPLTTTTGTSTELTSEVTLSVQLNSAFTVQNSLSGAHVTFKAGLNNTPSGATIVSEQAYVKRTGILRSAPGLNWSPIDKVGSEWIVMLPTNGMNYVYDLYYECTVRYAGTLSVYAAAQIIGSISDGVTRYYGGGYSLATMKADMIIVEDGTNAIKVTATGIFKTTDGGQTWVPY